MVWATPVGAKPGKAQTKDTETWLSSLDKLLSAMSNIATIHGGAWYNWFEKPVLKVSMKNISYFYPSVDFFSFKVLLFLTICFFFWTMVAMLALEGADFLADKSIGSSNEIIKMNDSDVFLPQFIVCHPYLFLKENIEGTHKFGP